jgi:hypothetical protein
VALSVVGTPFVLVFRAVVCAASAVVAGPTAALFAVSDDPRGGFDYLRDGLAQNCGPPYVVPVPVAARHDPAPGEPRPLTRYGNAAAPASVTVYDTGPNVGQPQRLTRHEGSVVASPCAGRKRSNKRSQRLRFVEQLLYRS